MTKEMKETVRHYLVLVGVTAFGISFISAFYVTFLLAKGLNYMEVNLVNLFFWATLFVCELPTGAFADVYGRKLSYLISCALFGVGMVGYGFASSFWGFVAAEMVLAVGQTFASGAFQAWLVDSLHQQGFTGSFAPIFSRKQQVANVVGMGAAILGAFLGAINLALPWFVGGGVMSVAGLLALVYMKEERVKKKLSFWQDMARMQNMVISSVKFSVGKPAVRFVLMVGVVLQFAVQAPNMYWQPFFQPHISSTTELGFLKAAMSVFLIIGAWLAPMVLRKVRNERHAIALTQFAIGLGILGTVCFREFGLILTVFMTHEIARGMADPLKESYLHDHVASDKRATVASCDSMSGRLGGMVGLVLSGALAQYWSLPSAWVVSGAVLAISALFMWRNGYKA